MKFKIGQKILIRYKWCEYYDQTECNHIGECNYVGVINSIEHDPFHIEDWYTVRIDKVEDWDKFSASEIAPYNKFFKRLFGIKETE